MSVMQLLLLNTRPADVITLNYMFATDITGRAYTAALEFFSNGVARATGGDSDSGSYAWINNGVNSGNYEIKVSLRVGETDPAPSGTLDTWLNLGTTRSWSMDVESIGTDLTIEIRDAATSTVRASNTATLQIDFA